MKHSAEADTDHVSFFQALRLKHNNAHENKQTSQRAIYGMRYREKAGKSFLCITCCVNCLFVLIIHQAATLIRVGDPSINHTK